MFSHQELGTVLFGECFLTQQRGTAWGNVWEWPICRHIDSTTVQYRRDSLVKLVELKARTRSISLHSLYIDIPAWLQKDLFSNHWRLFIHLLPKNFFQTQQRSTSSRRSCEEVVCLIPSFQKGNFFTQILISLKRNAFFAFLWSHMVTKLLNENLTSAYHTFTALCLLMYMSSLYCCYT